jgi:hypothetical protein
MALIQILVDQADRVAAQVTQRERRVQEHLDKGTLAAVVRRQLRVAAVVRARLVALAALELRVALASHPPLQGLQYIMLVAAAEQGALAAMAVGEQVVAERQAVQEQRTLAVAAAAQVAHHLRLAALVGPV